MSVRLAVLLCVLVALPVAALSADRFTDALPSYGRIAAQCGEDPSKPSFANSEYVSALSDAARAIKDASRKGERSRIEGIRKSVERLKECLAEEERKFTIPPIRNCRDFINEYRAFSARASSLLRSGKITEVDRVRVRETFRKPAEDCVRDMMTKCIDPTETSTVDFVIDAMTAAADFGFIYTYHRQTGFDRFLTINSPGNLRMRFCSDTDYACKGDRSACNRRIEQIKAIMETYMEK